MISVAIREKSIQPVIGVNGRGHYSSMKLKDKDYSKRVAIEKVNSRLKLEFGLDGLKLRSLSKAAFHAFSVIRSMLFAAVGSALLGFKGFRKIVSF